MRGGSKGASRVRGCARGGGPSGGYRCEAKKPKFCRRPPGDQVEVGLGQGGYGVMDGGKPRRVFETEKGKFLGGRLAIGVEGRLNILIV